MSCPIPSSVRWAVSKGFRTVLVLILLVFSVACAPVPDTVVSEDAFYYSLEDVTAYLQAYGELPDNFISKDEAYDLGWEPDEGNLWAVADGYCIGGDRFGNREGLLPEEAGRDWTEADINYSGGYRRAERIVFSDDGLIYYTDDHYDSFEYIGEYEP